MTSLSVQTVVLASSSETRLQILMNAGLSVEAVMPRVDEEEIRQALAAENAGAAAMSEVLAEQKARQVSRQQPGRLVIGADQILEQGGRIFAKPADMAAAREQLVALRGCEHSLYSCVCIVRDGQRLWHKIDQAKLTMRDFSDMFLEEYLRSVGHQALAGPGCYRIEGPGSQLFSQISGDYFTILGLPLIPLLDYLRIQSILPS